MKFKINKKEITLQKGDYILDNGHILKLFQNNSFVVNVPRRTFNRILEKTKYNKISGKFNNTYYFYMRDY